MQKYKKACNETRKRNVFLDYSSNLLLKIVARVSLAFYITIKNDHCLKNQLLFSYLCFQKSFIVQSNVQT